MERPTPDDKRVAVIRHHVEHGISLLLVEAEELLTALDAATARAEEAERKLGWLEQTFDAGMVDKSHERERATAAEAGREAERAAKTTAWAEAARLREALKPFAEAWNIYKGDSAHRVAISMDLLKDADAALAPTPPAVATVAPPCPRTDRECLFPECGCNAPTPPPAGVSEEAKEVAELIFRHVSDHARIMPLARALDNLAGRGRA